MVVSAVAGVGAGGSTNHQIRFKFAFVRTIWSGDWGDIRVESARSEQLAAMTWWVICGEGSHIRLTVMRIVGLHSESYCVFARVVEPTKT